MSSLSPSAPVGNPLTAKDGGGIPITIQIDGKPRTAGYAMPSGIWNRRMERSRHFWHKGGEAIGASLAALAEARRLGCVVCKVVDAESGDTYLCSIDDYERYGRPVQRPGWEPQRALNLSRWRIIRRDGTEIPPEHERHTAAPATTAPAVEQMSLFGAGD